MATIGTITRNDNGEFTGNVRTLTASTPIKLIPLGEAKSDRSPSHRVVTATGFEFGAAWTKNSKETGAEYMSLKLDTPELPTPIYANTGRMPGTEEQDGVLALIWNRT